MGKLLFSTALSVLAMLISTNSSYGQANTIHQNAIERYSPKLDAIIGKNPDIETIMNGFEWCEGPLWVEKEKMLLVSDVPQNTVYKWTQSKGKEIFLKPSGYTKDIPRGGEMGSNGLTLTKDGKLLLCQDGDRRLGIMNASLKSPKSDFKTLTDNYKGKKFNSPNDMSVAKNGDIYFTDPPYGLEKKMDDPLKELPFQGVFKVIKTGYTTLLTDTIDRPNGIALFPDGKSVLISNSFRPKPYIFKYDLDANGLLTNGTIFFDARKASETEKGAPDGLKIDKNGNVFASGPGGIWIISKSGEVLGRIKVSPVASNCALSGDEKTLFITADDHVLKVKLRN
ncbi:MAG TPA: SMP-30/gluconolactonase/LRE family protein [Sphingobacteriaceae bacterium]